MTRKAAAAWRAAGLMVACVAGGLAAACRPRRAPGARDAAERSAAHRYQLLAQHSRDIVLLLRRDGRILEANAAATIAYGRTRDELLSLTIHDLRGDLVKEVASGQMAEADARGILFEATHRRRDGSLFPVEVSSQGATIDGTRMLVSVIRDITERKRAEEERERLVQALRDADRKKDEFLGVLSHELRNPLAPIRNSVYLLKHAEAGTPQALRASEVIDRQTSHMTRLVDDLLDVTRIARGKVELRRARVDLSDVVRRTGEDHRSLMTERDIELTVEVPEEPVWVSGDATRLEQVVGNLLQNAAKFTPRSGRVALALRPERGQARIAVRDTGAGIEHALLDKVFDPFVQAERTLARSSGGLGLGLALVKGLAELHGGEASVSSDGPGTGSEFRIVLPLLAADGAAAPAQTALRDGGEERRPRRVLVVDDNVDAADSLAELVQTFGHETDVAYDGPTALATARVTRPDVILCDIGLPGMDGYEVARTLRADGALDGTRLVAVTGYAQPDDLARASAAGFDRHVAKPPVPEEIERLLA